MKKSILTIIFLSIAFFSFGQEFRFGIKAGGNLSDLRGEYPKTTEEYITIDHKPVFGFHIGGIAEYSINDRFFIQPELLVSFQGNKVETIDEFYDSQFDEYEKESFTQRPKLIYLNMPIMFKYKVADKLSIDFGPQVGYLLSSKSKWEYKDHNNPSFNESVTVDLLKDGTYEFMGSEIMIKKGMKNLDFGVNIGASYDLTNNIFAQIRYNYGIIRIDEHSTKGTDSDNSDYSSWDLKNTVIQLSLGYKF